MNYDNQTKVHDYWRAKISLHFSHKFTAISFDDYMRRFSFLPSGKWLRDMECIKITRVFFQLDPVAFVEKYAKQCVTYNAPVKQEDGIQRVIYQISPTLHVEAAFWVWMEQEVIQSYAALFACYHDEAEYGKFLEELYPIRRIGNTEDTAPKGFGGFGGFGKTS